MFNMRDRAINPLVRGQYLSQTNEICNKVKMIIIIIDFRF